MTLPITSEFTALADRIEALSQKWRQPRREDIATMALVVALYYVGLCPCCQRRRIVDDNGNPVVEHWSVDHWTHPSRIAPIDLWAVCRSCNQKLYNKTGFKAKHQAMFVVFQRRLMEQHSQLQFNFSGHYRS
jgi:hypothetical protein